MKKKGGPRGPPWLIETLGLLDDAGGRTRPCHLGPLRRGLDRNGVKEAVHPARARVDLFQRSAEEPRVECDAPSSPSVTDGITRRISGTTQLRCGFIRFFLGSAAAFPA